MTVCSVVCYSDDKLTETAERIGLDSARGSGLARASKMQHMAYCLNTLSFVTCCTLTASAGFESACQQLDLQWLSRQ
jgi:hypothetical protein